MATLVPLGSGIAGDVYLLLVLVYNLKLSFYNKVTFLL